jgi:2-keto-4-pentenoate hydratase
VKEARMVLELLGTRYRDDLAPSPIDLLADSYNHHGLFIGPVIPNIFDRELASLPVKITAGGKVLFERVHPHPSGGPMKSYSWLVQFLSDQALIYKGQGLKEGQIVTTGSYAGAVEAPIGVPLQVELSGIGKLDCELVTGAA